MNWTLPLVGLAIGWGTNILAIEMLFRPRKEYTIGTFRVPFTPGLIPLNRDNMIREAANYTSSMLLESFNTKDIESTEQFKLFNTLLDSFWFTQMFITNVKRKELFNRILFIIKNESSVRDSVTKVLIKQMNMYDTDKIEHTIRKISGESLNGIKIIGAFTGALVGILSMLLTL